MLKYFRTGAKIRINCASLAPDIQFWLDQLFSGVVTRQLIIQPSHVDLSRKERKHLLIGAKHGRSLNAVDVNGQKKKIQKSVVNDFDG